MILIGHFFGVSAHSVRCAITLFCWSPNASDGRRCVAYRFECGGVSRAAATTTALIEEGEIGRVWAVGGGMTGSPTGSERPVQGHDDRGSMAWVDKRNSLVYGIHSCVQT